MHLPPRSLYCLALLSFCLGLTACAPNLVAQSTLEQRAPDRANSAANAPTAAISRLQINTGTDQKVYSNGTDSLRQSFANAIFNSGRYAAVYTTLQDSAAPANAQTFDIVITPKFQQNIHWLWYLGILTGLGPFWPALPRDGSIELQMDLSIAKEGRILQKATLSERDTFDLFWYGAYRVWDLQTQSDFLYRKLLGRLTSLLADQMVTPRYATPDASGLVEDDTPIVAPAPIAKLGLAILDPECNGVDSLTGQTLNTKLRTELFGLGAFEILERDRMKDILAEQGFQQSGACTGTECYVRVGQLVGVDRIVIASFGKVGEMHLLTLRILSVSNGNVLEEVSVEQSGGPELLLTQGIPALVRKLNVNRVR